MGLRGICRCSKSLKYDLPPLLGGGLMLTDGRGKGVVVASNANCSCASSKTSGISSVSVKSDACRSGKGNSVFGEVAEFRPWRFGAPGLGASDCAFGAPWKKLLIAIK